MNNNKNERTKQNNVKLLIERNVIVRNISRFKDQYIAYAKLNENTINYEL